MKVFKPKAQAWLPLLIVGLPISALGVVALAQDASGWMWDLAAIAFGVGLIGYNARARLHLTNTKVTLKRFGRTVWEVPLKGTRMLEGRAGQPPVLPAYVLYRDKTVVGYLLKVWFDEQAVAEVRQALG